MPGLLVAAGIPDAERVLRRAALPLLRRPWERLSLAARDDVALGFAGERGGIATSTAGDCVVAVDGELYLPSSTREGAAAAVELLSLYQSQGPHLSPPEGAFAAALWDAARRTLVLLTDRSASRPLHVARRGNTTLAAGELKALVAAGLEPELDLQTWAELLAYEHSLGDRTTLAGVRALPAATTLVLGPSGEQERRRWRYRLDPVQEGDERELVEEFGRLLELGVSRRADGETALALSGGLDSRCLALALNVCGVDVLSATYGAPGSEDLVLGAEVARQLGLRHSQLPLAPGYIAGGAAETVWLGEGSIRCFHAHHLALRSLKVEDAAGSLMIGFDGDAVVRLPLAPAAAPGEAAFVAAVHAANAQCVTDALLEEVFEPSFAAELRGRTTAGLAESLAREDGDRQARYAQLILSWQDQPSALFDDHLAARVPFRDEGLVDFCCRLPFELRLRGRLERAYLRRHARLASLRSPKNGYAPALTGWAEQTAAWKVRARRRASSWLGSLPVRAPRPRRRGIGDYASDLRTGGRDLLALLLEPRTLARGQLRETAVRRLVTETLTGAHAHTRPLGMLLTLELFQRLFVDRDASGLSGGEELEALLTARMREAVVGPKPYA